MLRQPGFASAEKAAIGGVRSPYEKVVASAYDGDLAFFVLEMNEPPRVEMYCVTCRLEDGLWYATAGSSGTGDMWASTDEAGDVGDLVWCEEALPEADCVRVEAAGEYHEVAVANGYCLMILRDVGNDVVPLVKTWRVGGVWR